MEAVAGRFGGGGGIGGGNCGGVSGDGVGGQWVVAVVGSVMADGAETLAVALERRRSGAACDGPSRGHGGHVEEYFCVV